MKSAFLVLVALVPSLAGCAGSTLGSGVGDRLVVKPPYYAGARITDARAVGRVPIVFQRGSIFEPQGDGDTPLARLLAEMNARLDASTALLPLGAPALPGTPPDVSLSCELDASGDCVAIDPSDPHARQMRLAVSRPSATWIAALGERTAASGVEVVLVISLEIGEYWVYQRNILGAKEVRLGTGFVQPIPWLTSLDAPVQVVQLTGAVVNRDGRALRIGAEGLLARRTDIVMSGIGAQALIRDDDLQAIRTQRRDDLPGQPLVWEAALDLLVQSLLGE